MDCMAITQAPALDTSNAEDFQYMFNRCANLRDTDVIYDSSKVKNFNYMFAETKSCDHMPVKLSDTSNGESFAYMFQNSNIKEQPTTLNTLNGTNFAYMFDGCANM